MAGQQRPFQRDAHDVPQFPVGPASRVRAHHRLEGIEAVAMEVKGGDGAHALGDAGRLQAVQVEGVEVGEVNRAEPVAVDFDRELAGCP